MRRKTGVLELPFGASGAVTRDRFVTQTGDETVVRAAAAGARALGVAQLDISADEQAKGKTTAVQVLGVALVEASAAIARGDRVSSSADGRGKTAIATEIPAGIALDAAAAAGEKIGVLLTPGLPAV